MACLVPWGGVGLDVLCMLHMAHPAATTLRLNHAAPGPEEEGAEGRDREHQQQTRRWRADVTWRQAFGCVSALKSALAASLSVPCHTHICQACALCMMQTGAATATPQALHSAASLGYLLPPVQIPLAWMHRMHVHHHNHHADAPWTQHPPNRRKAHANMPYPPARQRASIL